MDISKLAPNAPIRRQLRKPEFQRETNHWSPEQVVTLIKSFIDGDVIPSIILWRSTNFIFVIDGAHRLSALCAWISDDYGDKAISTAFYDSAISKEQKRVALRTRALVEKEVGSFASLEGLVGKPASGLPGKRAGSMFSRPIYLQEVIGTPKVAEDSFFAINSQGTPLDDTEKLLIKARNKPVAIGLRAIVRGGKGHAYWSTFSQKNQQEVVALANEFHEMVFQPEITQPLRTLDLPLAGSASPVDALSVLVDFLSVANSKSPEKVDDPFSYIDDETGDETIAVLTYPPAEGRLAGANVPLI